MSASLRKGGGPPARARLPAFRRRIRRRRQAGAAEPRRGRRILRELRNARDLSRSPAGRRLPRSTCCVRTCGSSVSPLRFGHNPGFLPVASLPALPSGFRSTPTDSASGVPTGWVMPRSRTTSGARLAPGRRKPSRTSATAWREAAVTAAPRPAPRLPCATLRPGCKFGRSRAGHVRSSHRRHGFRQLHGSAGGNRAIHSSTPPWRLSTVRTCREPRPGSPTGSEHGAFRSSVGLPRARRPSVTGAGRPRAAASPSGRRRSSTGMPVLRPRPGLRWDLGQDSRKDGVMTCRRGSWRAARPGRGALRNDRDLQA